MTLGHLFLVLDGRDHVADDVWQPIPFVSVLDWSMSDSALQGVIWGLDHASCFNASLGRGWAAGADPAGISESSCSHAEADPHNALGGNPRISAARTVLVVEDGKVNQTVICRQLERLGFCWVLAEDGEEGFKLATREHARFCLVLMDAHMPKMDGLEATRRIRQWEVEHPSFPALHIVALTAAALPEDRQAFFDAGVDGFESKPLRLQRLRELLAALPSE
jgi:CheY-like chemotaxis protein